MTEETAPTPKSPESTGGGRSGYRASTPVTVDSRNTGGSGVQRSHLRDRKAWLKARRRAGLSWAQRKAASQTYCPAKTRAG